MIGGRLPLTLLAIGCLAGTARGDEKAQRAALEEQARVAQERETRAVNDVTKARLRVRLALAERDLESWIEQNGKLEEALATAILAVEANLLAETEETVADNDFYWSRADNQSAVLKNIGMRTWPVSEMARARALSRIAALRVPLAVKAKGKAAALQNVLNDSEYLEALNEKIGK